MEQCNEIKEITERKNITSFKEEELHQNYTRGNFVIITERKTLTELQKGNFNRIPEQETIHSIL
jgi:hypothetical protein